MTDTLTIEALAPATFEFNDSLGQTVKLTALEAFCVAMTSATCPWGSTYLDLRFLHRYAGQTIGGVAIREYEGAWSPDTEGYDVRDLPDFEEESYVEKGEFYVIADGDDFNIRFEAFDQTGGLTMATFASGEPPSMVRWLASNFPKEWALFDWNCVQSALEDWDLPAPQIMARLSEIMA